MDTLVLDTAFQPMRKITWQEAMKLWAAGRVEIVAEYSNRFIKTTSKLFNVPSVIRFVKNTFKRFKKAIKFSKNAIYKRDGGRCQYCTKKMTLGDATKDHVFPKSRGGKTSWTNIVIACKSCNQKKRNKTPEEANMKLLSIPRTPQSLQQVSHENISVSELPEGWKFYLGIE